LLLANDVARLKEPGKALYTCMLKPDGGVIDDLIVYFLSDTWYRLVVNAGTRDKDLAWIRSHAAPFAVDVLERSDLAMIAVQGPEARRRAANLLAPAQQPGALEIKPFHGAPFGSWFVARTGYTGEDGFEIMLPAADAPDAWRRLAASGVKAAGLGARDTLRLEACFHLYGNDLSVERNPIEAGLGWCCKEGTGFIGAEAVAAMRAQGPPQKLVAFAIEGQGIARTGNEILGGGVVTSGTLSPCLRIGGGLAYVPAEQAAVGGRLQIDVRGRVREAVVRKKPLFSKG
jgi:aminomethyltransferase